MIIENEYEQVNFSDLLGETLTKVDVDSDNTEIIFTFETGQKVKMYHEQGCCENVWLEDVCGDWDDLIGRKIETTREDSHQNEAADESETWTFYNLGSDYGNVTLRWCGQSNGYYSESVNLELL